MKAILLLLCLGFTGCAHVAGSACSTSRPYCYSPKEEARTQQALSRCSKWPERCKQEKALAITKAMILIKRDLAKAKSRFTSCKTLLKKSATPSPVCKDKLGLGVAIGAMTIVAVVLVAIIGYVIVTKENTTWNELHLPLKP